MARWASLVQIWQNGLVVLAWLITSGCDDGSPAGPGTGGASTDSAQVAVVFTDTSLEAVVRQALAIPTGLLAQTGLDSLTQLVARNRGITNLTGIGSLGNLQVLDLADNQVQDLTPLQGLSRLRYLDLSNNQIDDLSPLSRLTALEYLVLSFNQIVDLSPLLGLPHLQSMDLSYNPLGQSALEQQLPLLHTTTGQVVYVPIPETETPADTLSPVFPWAIAFLSDREGNYDVWAMQADGSRPIKLTNTPGYIERFAFAPDGSQFVFTIAGDKEGAGVVYRQDFYTLRTVILFRATSKLPGGRYYYWPDPWWLPDAVRVVITPAYSETAFPVYVVDTRDDHVDTLQWEGSRCLPSWSPDGRQIAYYYTDDSLVSQKAPVWDLCVQEVEGGGQRILRRDVRNIGRPAWSPDGKQLAFFGMRGHGIQVWTINEDGSGLRCLTEHDGGTANCSWSPDGRLIAYDFAELRAIASEVYVMEADGSNPINLTQLWSSDRAPVWFYKHWEW